MALLAILIVERRVMAIAYQEKFFVTVNNFSYIKILQLQIRN